MRDYSLRTNDVLRGAGGVQMIFPCKVWKNHLRSRAKSQFCSSAAKEVTRHLPNVT